FISCVPDHTYLIENSVDLVIAKHTEHDTAPDTVRLYVRFVASPRGAQALVLTAIATALLDGRPSVAAEDLRAVAHGALRHRLVLGYEAVADGVTADQIVDAVLDAVPSPGTGLRGAPRCHPSARWPARACRARPGPVPA